MLAAVSLGKLAASGGLAAATLRFRRGEYLYNAWLLLALHMVPLTLKDLLFGKLVHLPGALLGSVQADLRQACSILGNVVFVVAMVLLGAGGARVAGFAACPGRRPRRG